jgi:predicted dehydrogenase
MKQVVQNYYSGDLWVAETPLPPVRKGWLVVANHASLISAGTEKSSVNLAQKSLMGKALDRPEMAKKVLAQVQKEGVVNTLKLVMNRLDTPVALGYSCAGTVLALGEGVQGFGVGDRVACAGQNYASHAEVVSVPKNLCAKIPDGVKYEDAAFVTLGAIALQGVRQADVRLGECIGVIGLGLLGQLTVQLLKASGCLVVGSDLDPTKNQLAKQFGADLVVSPEELVAAAQDLSRHHGLDAVIIAASTKDSRPVELAGQIARKKGRVVVVGAVGMTVPREVFYAKELELRLSTSYGPGRYDSAYEEQGQDYPYGYVRWTENRNMEAVLALLAQKRLVTAPLISQRFPIEEAQKGYEALLEKSSSCLGIVLTYTPSSDILQDRIVRVSPSKPGGQVMLGLIGAGNHVRDRLLPCLTEWKAVRFQGVCTTTPVKARDLATKLSASFCTGDYQEILRHPSVNAVLIGTRHDSHGLLVREALEAGKHVFVEKPLCLREEELQVIKKAYQQSVQQGLQLLVGFNRRFSQHMEKAREFFQECRNPLVMNFRVNAGAIPATHWIQDPEIGGGRIVGEVCHFVDYLQTLCGALPVSVQASRIAAHASGVTDDQCLITLQFQNGSIGVIVYAAGGDTAVSKERLEVFGDDKTLIMDDFRTSEFYSKGQKRIFRSSQQDKGFQEEMNQFVTAMTKGGQPVIPFCEIEAVTQACFLASRSLMTGERYPIVV